MNLPFNLICIDLETTDLDSHTGSIIQIGAIIVNKDFEIDETSGEFNLYVKPLDSYRNPQSMSVNKISEEVLVNAMSLNDTLELFENFCDKNKMLASWGVYFDIPFLYAQYKKINRKWPFSHKCFDLKSVAIWESAKDDKPISGGIFSFLKNNNETFDGIQHEALSDIKNAVKILKYYKGRK